MNDKNLRIRNGLRIRLETKKAELEKLKKCKDYIWNNFEATQEECDSVLDIIAQVIDRKETEIKNIKSQIVAYL